jgi:hypothetical protein
MVSQMKAESSDPKPEVRLIFKPAPGDLPLSSPEFQKELREFYRAVRPEGVTVAARSYAHEAVGGGGGLTREFTILVTSIAPVLKASAVVVVGAWLHAKYGRKLRAKFGDNEAEASTLEELEKIVRLLEEIQQRNKPKIIREP